MLGRGVIIRVTTVVSSGSTWYFLASCMNSACISFSFAGYLAATSSDCVQSVLRSYSSHGTVIASCAGAVTSQGGRTTLVLAIQPSWYSARSPIISKYWVLRVEGALAFFASKVYIMLTPSIGFCLIPSTTAGCLTPAACRMVGTMSMMWWNWSRTPPFSLITLGHEIAMPCLMPPKCEAICLVHENGVSNAQAHGTAMWL